MSRLHFMIFHRVINTRSYMMNEYKKILFKQMNFLAQLKLATSLPNSNKNFH